jgi:DNA-binding transcriptional ArsR family regulator
MRRFFNITRALSDATRVRTLLALRGGELCVCQITEFCRLAVSTVSKHLAILHQAGLVETRKEGRWIYYRLPGKDADPVVREAIDWVEKSLAKDPQVREDVRQLRQLLKEDPSELCRRQCQR